MAVSDANDTSPDVDQDGNSSSETTSEPVNATRRFNPIVIAITLAIVVGIALAIGGVFYFISQERERDIQSWQIRLGIVADSRAAAVNSWVDQNFKHLRELAENASLQVYMSSLPPAGSLPTPGSAAPDTSLDSLDSLDLDSLDDTTEPSDASTESVQSPAIDDPVESDGAASASYLLNLLNATAERTGFKPPSVAGEVSANVERPGLAGLGLVDNNGNPLVSTADMPPMSAKIRAAVANALEGEPAFIDVYNGASDQATIGFVLPIYGIQDDGSGAKSIGAVIGIKLVGDDLYQSLIQPGELEKTSETNLVRKTGATVEYLTPLKDGTPALKRSLSMDTPELAAAEALNRPGGFGQKRDYGGIDVLVTSRNIATLPWVLVRKISEEEALSGTNSRLTTILSVFIALIIGIGVSIVAVWRHGSSLRATQAAANMQLALERFTNMSKFMQRVTDNQDSIIVAVDGNTLYTFANAVAANEAGIPVEDIMGKSMASVIGPIKAAAFAEINNNVLKTMESESHVVSFGDENNWDKSSDDCLEVIKSDHIPLRGDRDYPPGVLMIQTDISELTIQRKRSERMLRELINTLVSVVDRRDPFSANHSSRVAEVARCIAMEMGEDELEKMTVDIAGNLMNLGKIFIPSEVLTKTTDLTPEERAMTANAYLTTVDLIEGVSFEGPVVETIRQLGETWQGKGPLGLKEEEIIRTARILAVANSFIGMISPRAYRGAMPFEKAADILMSETGTRFDRRPVTALINFLENRDGKKIWAHFREISESQD